MATPGGWNVIGTGSRAIAQLELADGFVAVALLSRRAGVWGVERLEFEQGRILSDAEISPRLDDWQPTGVHLNTRHLKRLQFGELLAEVGSTEEAVKERQATETLCERALELRAGAKGSDRLLGFRRILDRDAHLDRLAAAFLYSLQPGLALIERELDLTAPRAAATLVSMSRSSGYLSSAGAGSVGGTYTARAEARLNELERAYNTP